MSSQEDDGLKQFCVEFRVDVAAPDPDSAVAEALQVMRESPMLARVTAVFDENWEEIEEWGKEGSQ